MPSTAKTRACIRRTLVSSSRQRSRRATSSCKRISLAALWLLAPPLWPPAPSWQLSHSVPHQRRGPHTRRVAVPPDSTLFGSLRHSRPEWLILRSSVRSSAAVLWHPQPDEPQLPWTGAGEQSACVRHAHPVA